jgi:ArsR family transcriptional regulator, cadmium/lead-responsive transcriptional repressor
MSERASGADDEQLWAAVTEPGRRRLLDVLVVLGEATPTALAVELPFTRQAVSKHLAVLLEAGLVTQRREGREVVYTVQPDRLQAAARTMTATANRWNARLNAIKRIAETLHHAGTTAAPHHREGP